MKKLILLFGLFFILAITAYSQNPQWITYNTTNSGLPGNGIISIIIDENGAKWLGTYLNGLAEFDGINWNTFPGSPSWLESTSVHQIARDENGIFWFNCEYTLLKYDGISWTTINEGNGGPCSIIEALAVEGNGLVWVGSLTVMEDGCGLKYTTDGSNWNSFYTFNSGIPDDIVLYITIDEYGNKWLNCNGLTKFSSTGWTNYNTNNSGIPAYQIKSIAFENSTLWIGTFGGGLTKFDGLNWTTYNTYNSDIPSNHICSISVDGDGIKWIGTNNKGLIKFDGSTWEIFNNSNSGLPNNAVHAITIDENGSKWIGTDEGLVVFNENGIPVSYKENREIEDNLKAFPNPTKEVLTIELLNGINLSRIEIIGIMGNVVKSQHVSKSQSNIDIMDLPSGVFFIRLYTDQGVILKRIIKH